MKIVFALIWITYSNYGGGPVKVGEYEKYSQCIEQGKLLTPTPPYQTQAPTFLCIPVNATGDRP